MKTRPDTASSPQAVEDCHELIAWIIPQIEKFPRARRFTLGERIEQGLLDVLELLIEAAYSRNKAPLLGRANLRLDVVRHLWRLASGLLDQLFPSAGPAPMPQPFPTLDA